MKKDEHVTDDHDHPATQTLIFLVCVSTEITITWTILKIIWSTTKLIWSEVVSISRGLMTYTGVAIGMGVVIGALGVVIVVDEADGGVNMILNGFKDDAFGKDGVGIGAGIDGLDCELVK